MIFICYYFLLTIIQAIPNPQSDSSINVTGVGKNPDIHLDLPCNLYRDCFNCTLAQCNWHVGNESCDYTYDRNVSPLDMLTVWQAVYGTCKDPLDLCSYDKHS